MFLFFSYLCAFALIKLLSKKQAKTTAKYHFKMPLQKNYTNPYIYFADLDRWNDECYKNYLDWCAENAEIPIDKQNFSIQHESRKRNFDKLIK